MRGKWIDACGSHCIHVGSTRMQMFVYTVDVAQTRDTVGRGTCLIAERWQLRSVRLYVIRRVRVHGTSPVWRMRSRLFVLFLFSILFFAIFIHFMCDERMRSLGWIRCDDMIFFFHFFFSFFLRKAAAIFMGGKLNTHRK